MKTSNAILGDAKHMVTAKKDAGMHELAAMRAELNAGISGVGNSLNEARLALKKQATSARNATQDYISDNPWRSIGIVAVAGIVIGVLLSRR